MTTEVPPTELFEDLGNAWQLALLRRQLQNPRSEDTAFLIEKGKGSECPRVRSAADELRQLVHQ